MIRNVKAPVCTQKPQTLEYLNDKREDPYYWLNDRENPEVIAYLEAENSYTESVLADGESFRDSLFNEMKGRIKEDDQSVPYFLRGYWYYTRFEIGGEYPVHCRKLSSLEAEEEVILNVNELAVGHDFFDIGGLSVSPDNRLLAYSVDKVSRRIYTIHFKDLNTGEHLPVIIENTTGGSVWANDNNTVFYSTKDEQTLRSNRIYRFSISDETSTEIYFEADETFHASISKTKSREFIILVSSSTLTTEYRYLSASNPTGEFTIFQPRTRGLEYGIAHFKDRWYVLTNLEAKNFRLMQCGLNTTSSDNWVEVVAHRDDVLLEGIELFDDYMVLEERYLGLTRLIINQFSTGKITELPVDDPCYTLGTGTNPEFNTNILRYGYTSLTTPASSYDYNMETAERVLLKQQEVIGGHNPEDYISERLFVKSRDGVDIPVSIVYHKNFVKDGNAPVLLYGYGSYGHSMDPTFSSIRLTLLNRGFAFAIAHIRGGEELGRHWYDDGKLLNKINTFNDFIDCGNYLIANRFTSSRHLYGMGGSAGGLLIGAVINMAPNLFNGVVAAVPFVDVLTTMLDETIPLTTGEFDEWGNPKLPEYYEYIKSYSPYDNIEEKEYPNMLVTTGLHDSQVQYWEPAKWVARLREKKTGNNVLLFKTEMKFGHGGASGRFEPLKEIAMEYAFLFDLEGITE